jgi:hypothetical protein
MYWYIKGLNLEVCFIGPILASCNVLYPSYISLYEIFCSKMVLVAAYIIRVKTMNLNPLCLFIEYFISFVVISPSRTVLARGTYVPKGLVS